MGVEWGFCNGLVDDQSILAESQLRNRWVIGMYGRGRSSQDEERTYGWVWPTAVEDEDAEGTF